MKLPNRLRFHGKFGVTILDVILGYVKVKQVGEKLRTKRCEYMKK